MRAPKAIRNLYPHSVYKFIHLAFLGIILEKTQSKSLLTMCRYHVDEECLYYCRKCKVCICRICGQRLHDNHTKAGIQQAAEERKRSLEKILFEAKAEIVAVERKIRKQLELREKSKSRTAAAKKKVISNVEGLIQVLRDHENVVKVKLTEIDEKQEKNHLARLEKLETFASELRKSVERSEGIFQRDNAVEILEDENVVFTPCKELLSRCQKMKVYTPDDISYVVDTTNMTALREMIQQSLDQIVVSDHSRSVAQGKGLNEADLGAQAEFTVITKDSEGKQFYSEQGQVTVFVESMSGAEEVHIIDEKDGIYTVHYNPRSVGPYQIDIEINGWPLTGSSWRVDVKPHQYKVVRSCGSRGKTRGKLKGPASIAKNEKTGNITVAEFDKKRFQVLDTDLNYLMTRKGVAGPQTENTVKIGPPWSVAFLRNSDMIVIHGDLFSRKMSLITNDGQFIKKFSGHVIDPGSLFVKTDRDGHVIVCDEGDREIKVLSSDGAKLLQSFSAPGCNAVPSCVFYHRDKFFVSYWEIHHVKVFDGEGKFLFNIGSEGSGKGQLMYPRSLVVDAFDNLIVCDSGNKRLQMFTQDGTFLSSFGQEIQTPWSMTICFNGDLLVTDYGKHCIYTLR